MREIDFLRLLIKFIKWKVNYPTKRKLVSINKFQIMPKLVSCSTGKAHKIFWHTGTEKYGVAIFKPKLSTYLFSSLRPNIFCNRTRSFTFSKENITKSGLPLTLSPTVHTITKCPASARFGRNTPDLYLVVFFNHIGKDFKIRTAKGIRNTFHFNRNTQVRLVRTVFPHCFCVRNSRECFSYTLAIAKFDKYIVKHGFNCIEHIFLSDKAHFYIQLIKLTG